MLLYPEAMSAELPLEDARSICSNMPDTGKTVIDPHRIQTKQQPETIFKAGEIWGREDDAGPRFQHAAYFGQKKIRVHQMFDDLSGKYTVKGLVIERKASVCDVCDSCVQAR